jgi:aryl-alcohol dehydrogenase-like predicted oxidoreductase
MDFRSHTILGRTGLSVSRLGIAASYDAPAFAMERAFHEFGVNFFYWGSVRKAGMRDALINLKGDYRDGLVIAFQSYDKSGLVMRRFHEKGLRDLGIDCADVLILGWMMKGAPRGRMLDAALRLKEEGKVRYLAASSHNRPLLGELVARHDLPVDIYMLRYNAAHRGAETDIFPRIPAESPPGIMAYTATRWGQLLQEKRMPPGQEPLTASECYRFALTDPHVDLVMTGPRTADELGENLGALELGPLSDAEMERVRRIGDWVYGKGKR